MATLSLKAHYDGKTIRLDEPFDLPPNTRLLVTVLDDSEDSSSLAAMEMTRRSEDAELDETMATDEKA
jgi:hypothetical protein